MPRAILVHAGQRRDARLICLAVFIAIVTFLGCGRMKVAEVPLIRVRGVVTLDGSPLMGAVVVFESADRSFSCAQTDSMGRYDLRFDSRSRGVTLGIKTVRISMNRRIRGLNSNDEGGPGDRAGGAFPKQPAERVPDRYNVRSTLTVEVRPDSNTFDFDLVSDRQEDAKRSVQR